MKLVRLGPPGQERPAVLVDETTALDLSGHIEDFGPSFFAEGRLPQLQMLLDGGDLPQLRVGPDTRYGSCIAGPGHIVGIGLNYADHAAESGQPVPDEPVVFSKAPSSLSGPNDPVLIPPDSQKTDWEVELGVVIGAKARYLPDQAAADAVIAGFCVVNDVSERHLQLERGGQWVKGKSYETFCPTGPWLCTPDEIDDAQDLAMFLDVNGVRMQTGSTKAMVFGVRHLIWYLSHCMVLEPGDLIATGTPPGVALGMSPSPYLKEGDVMELGIEGLGNQRQVCARAQV